MVGYDFNVTPATSVLQEDLLRPRWNQMASILYPLSILVDIVLYLMVTLITRYFGRHYNCGRLQRKKMQRDLMLLIADRLFNLVNGKVGRFVQITTSFQLFSLIFSTHLIFLSKLLLHTKRLWVFLF